MGHGVSLARMSCGGIPRLKAHALVRESKWLRPGPVRPSNRGVCARGMEAWVGSGEVFVHGVAATPARSGRLGQGLFAESGPRSQPGPKQVRPRCRGHSHCGWGNRSLQNAALRRKHRIACRETAPGLGVRMSTATRILRKARPGASARLPRAFGRGGGGQI
jgi:hypothetical protein